MTALRVELKDICTRLGLREMPDVLEACVNPVLRGHHLAVLAAEGSGEDALIGLAVLENVETGSAGTQALVLVSDTDRARRIAAAVQRIAGPEGIRVSFAPSRASETVPPAVLVGRPSDLLPEVRAGRCPLAEIRLFVMDGVASMHDVGEWESLEPFLDTLPRDCRKIAISERAHPEFMDLLERQLPRARRWPEELLNAGLDSGPEDTQQESLSPVLCGLALPSDFAEALERCALDADRMDCSQVSILCLAEVDATRVAAELSIGGRQVEQDGSTVRVALAGEGSVAVLQAGLPLRLDQFAPALEGDGPRYAVVEPRHAAQLELLLRRSGRRMNILPGAALGRNVDPIQKYRLRLREEATHGDILSELLVLEPLFEEIGVVRLAAVLSRLLRRRSDTPGTVRPWADVEEALTDESVRPGGGKSRSIGEPDRVPRGVRPAWTRLYFGVGRRDEVQPGDLVGAITGEAEIAGGQVGKIEIMGNFSLVDIDSQVADEVIGRLDGATIRGRTVPVRRDRNI